MVSEEDRISAYDPSATRLLLGEVAYLLQEIGFAGAHITIIGGLVPGLLVPIVDPPLEAHVGSRDVDFCLSVALVEGDVGNYERLERSLRRAGFEMAREDNQPVTWRWIGGRDVRVTVEFFCPATPDRPAGRLFRPGGVVGSRISAMALESGLLIDEDWVEREVEIELPRSGGRANVPMRITGIASYLAAKSDAIARRSKNKDAYDVVWLIEAWEGGPQRAARAAGGSAIGGREEFLAAMRRLEGQFAKVDAIGARRYAAFLGHESAEERDISAARSVGAFREFFKALSEV